MTPDLLTSDEREAMERVKRVQSGESLIDVYPTPRTNRGPRFAKDLNLLAAALIRLSPILSLMGTVADELRRAMSLYKLSPETHFKFMGFMSPNGITLGQARTLVAALPKSPGCNFAEKDHASHA